MKYRNVSCNAQYDYQVDTEFAVRVARPAKDGERNGNGDTLPDTGNEARQDHALE